MLSSFLMKQNYLSILLFLCLNALSFAQEAKPQPKSSDTIDGLNFYPNPVSNGKIYIVSKNGEDKEIVIFDVLGKKVFQAVLTGKELNIGNLSPGVYIIKIKEDDATATRKLIVR